MSSIEKHKDHIINTYASDIDKQLYNELKNVSNMAYNKMKAIYETYQQYITEILQKHYAPDFSCNELSFNFLYIRKNDESAQFGYRIFTLKHEYKENVNNLIKTKLFDDNWQCRYENSIFAESWGYELLHNYDSNIEIRKKLDECYKDVILYHDIWMTTYDRIDDIIIKYEK